ncbi:glycosyltransferase [Raoultella terrigena]|uniref:glycosyltransferase n=1 Tax=Raoultella terrigena TaxID=577 RepID=UPI0011D22F1D|nr:glycosyltransferase [Raoultella terrigena]
MHILDSTPKVSIYISTYNRLEKLKRAIDSVLNQDYQNWELLVCDDASNDDTSNYMHALVLTDNRIRYFRNDSNKGACVTRNLGIFNASGLFITGLDDDDEFSSDRLTFFLKHWENKYSFICCDFLNKYPNGYSSEYYKQNELFLVFGVKNILYENEASNQIFTLTERLKAIGGFSKDVRRLQDWDTWLRLSYAYGDFIRFNKVSYIMHHDHDPHETRVSQNEKITSALLSLSERNSNIYLPEEQRFMRYVVDSMNKKASFSESLYWAFKKKKPKFMIKYFLKR